MDRAVARTGKFWETLTWEKNSEKGRPRCFSSHHQPGCPSKEMGREGMAWCTDIACKSPSHPSGGDPLAHYCRCTSLSVWVSVPVRSTLL